MKRKGLVFAGLLGVIMMFCGTVYAEEQASQQNDQQSYNYQTEDGVLSIRIARKPDGKPTYRWEMVQSHTFRRSAITELYLSGVPAKDCMFLSGHKSLRAFETYVRTSKEQAAVRMKDNPFFK